MDPEEVATNTLITMLMAGKRTPLTHPCEGPRRYTNPDSVTDGMGPAGLAGVPQGSSALLPLRLPLKLCLSGEQPRHLGPSPPLAREYLGTCQQDI